MSGSRPPSRQLRQSSRIAEAALKEWVMTHGRDFDWNLDDVKAICLRNQRDGIPHEWLPEAEKRR